MLVRKTGKIDISDLNIPPKKHELRTAQFFTGKGKDIKFIRPSNKKGDHRPDFWMDGKKWETKYPRGNSSRTIENNFRDAIKQSRNIIFDLRSMGRRKENAIVRIKTEFNLRHIGMRVLIIISEKDYIDLSK